MSSYVTVAKLSDFPAQGGLDVTLGGRRIALFRTGSEYHALDAICPHRGGPLSAGWVENGRVFCPMHGWEFQLGTGACLTNSERTIRAYAVRILGEEVQIDWPEAIPAGRS
jgi:nitrite reductase [NAD(P)H] small subunit